MQPESAEPRQTTLLLRQVAHMYYLRPPQGRLAHRRSHEPVDAEDILASPFYELLPEVPEVLVFQRLTLLSYHVEEGAECLEWNV